MLTFDKTIGSKQSVIIGERPLSIREAHEVAGGRCRVSLTKDADRLRRVEDAAALVQQAVDDRWPVYGVTTGFGGMANVPVPSELAAASQDNLLTFLATGAGRAIDRRHVRAAMALRANVLLCGYSGTRLELIERLVCFLNANATPIVRELGSIGASGDLVPLSSIARAITGSVGQVRVQLGEREMDGAAALQELGLEPLHLQPKEGLAIVNGTSFSCAVAANCVAETKHLVALAIGAQAMMLRALQVQEEPFESFVHERKPHPGQIIVAQCIRRLLSDAPTSQDGRRAANGAPNDVQDRYSLRCLPQYLGPIVEGLVRVTNTIETEMNAVSDNPLVDAEGERFFQSGNFLGQYIGIAMDDLRRFIGLTAKHLDVQIACLVAPEFSKGLPESLRGNSDVSYNMGLKGLQITGNSIMPMLTYLGTPLVEQFPTHAEQFNQNVNGLSWGAANLAWKSVELFQHYLAVALIFSVQSLDLRAKMTLGHYDGRTLLGPAAEPLYSATYAAMDCQVGQRSPFLFNDSDQWLEQRLASLYANISENGSVIEAVIPILASLDSCPR